MKKTIKEWFDYLPEDIKRLALINNINDNKANRMDLKFDNLVEAIDHAFFWADTSKGQDYWSDIVDNAKKGKYNTIPIKGIKKKLIL